MAAAPGSMVNALPNMRALRIDATARLTIVAGLGVWQVNSAA
jgi:hypothetical protein